MDEKYLNLFHIPIQISKLELDIDSLIKFCYEMKRKDEIGIERTNIGGWHSDNIFKETHPEFVKLKNEVEEAVNLYHHEVQFKKKFKQKIYNFWVNINQKGHSNEFHIHAGAILSGAFYLRGKAPIIFRHPFGDINTYYWGSSLIEEWNGGNSEEMSILPEPNVLLVFPAWLWHKVRINKENTDRVSLSFNSVIHETEKENE